MTFCPACQTTYPEDANFCSSCGSDMRHERTGPAEPDPWLGRTVDNRYRVLAKIGQGGMGSVYRVEHLAMGKVAAMKVMHGELAIDREAVKRFRREAEAVSRLGHPNTVQVFDFGQTGECMYLVMEFVRGEDLGAILHRDRQMAFPRAAPIVAQVCASLAEAHELGIVHRDLKPENILVTRTRDGQDFAKVLDFGLAKIRERGEETASITARGSLVGTPYYMSPEQIRSDGQPDARSDVYSLGGVLYRMLCGTPPFTAQTPIGVLTKHLSEAPPPPRARCPELEIPVAAEAICLRALEKRQEDRFQSIDEMREAIEKARATPVGPTLVSSPSGAGTLPQVPPAAPSGPAARSAMTPSQLRALEIGSQPTLKTPFPDPEPERSVAPAGAASAAPGEAIAQRLSRSDFDRYERGLKRHKGLRLVLVPLLVVGAAVGGWFLSQRTGPSPGPLTVELEPNDDSAHANPITAAHPIRGKIGQRLSREEGDRDVYRIAASPGTPTRLLAAQVSGLPNMDLLLQVNTAQGDLVASADSQGQGEGEVLPNLRLGDGEYYLLVRQVHVPGEVPTENVTDEYTIQLDWHPLGAGEEAEPNDPPSEPMAVAPDQTVTGYLGSRADIDRFRIDAPAGRKLRGELTLPDGALVRVRIGEHELPGTKAGAPWSFVVAGQQVITIERKEGPRRGNERPPLAGLDRPYRLKFLPPL